MPKGNRRAKNKRGNGDPVMSLIASAGVDSTPDASTISLCSGSAGRWDAESADGYQIVLCGGEATPHALSPTGETAPVVIDNFEDKLLIAMDGCLASKSMKGRIQSIESLRRGLASRFAYDFIVSRKITLMDIMERSIKRAKGEEVGVAAQLAAVIATSLGVGSEVDDLYRELQPILMQIIIDPTASAKVRGQCAHSLAIISFIASAGLDSHGVITTALRDIFSGSFAKGNGTMPVLPPEVTALHAKALNGWTLLQTISSTSMVAAEADGNIMRLSQLLESSDLDLRMAAGEAIAVICEISYEHDPQWTPEVFDLLMEKLQALATDSHKFRAKKDRRTQRSTFREVVRAVDLNEPPAQSVKFGLERLEIDTWATKHQYNEFLSLLGPGMNAHLGSNDLLREIFFLGPPINDSDCAETKDQKRARHLANLSVGKARSKARNKQRDKRADVVCA